MLLQVPLETLRTWDSGRRAIPARIFAEAKHVVADRPRQTELLSLDLLARELGVHERTLRAAARSGRLVVEFSQRSAFGRPIRQASRAAAAEFMRRYYRRCYSRYCTKPAPPDISVPSDYDRRVAACPSRFTPHAICVRRADWCGRQSRCLSVGDAEAPTVAGVLAADSGSEYRRQPSVNPWRQGRGNPPHNVESRAAVAREATSSARAPSAPRTS